MHRVAKQKVLAMEVRAFKLQDFTAWPASGGYVSLATSMVRDHAKPTPKPKPPPD